LSDPGRRRWSRLLPRQDVVGWTSLWIAIAALVVLPYVHSYHHLSPFDEVVHLDYLVKVQDGHMVRDGEKIGPVAMRSAACRGSDLENLGLPDCAQKVLRPEAFPFEGFNSAYPDPPGYYLVTAAGATVIDVLPGVNDVVTAARSVGVLWLGAGLGLTFLLALRLGANRWAAAGATLIVGTTPSVTHAMATITSDAPSLLVGAALCLVAMSVVRGQVAWWWLAPAAATTTAMKATGLTVCGLVVVFLLLHLVGSRRAARSSTRGVPEVDAHTGPDAEAGPVAQVDLPVPLAPRTIWLAVAAVVVPGVAVLGGWVVVNKVTELPSAADSPMRDFFYVDSIGWDQVVGNLLQLATPLQIGYEPPFMNDVTITIVMGLVNAVAFAGVAALAWTGVRGAVPTRLAIATTISMLAGGAALTLFIFVGSHTLISIPPRYGMSLLPAVAAALAVIASRRRAGGYGLAGIGVASLAALLVQTL